ncbi:MAG TPA: bifunctional phosphoglucose/phosphomannose isomerase [Candidatus Eisenbacteria bacterium]|nr:bifunctional phosphoglucose/phosphomannose isomerase [Candidatus Eisenbacteria bacterium]
MSELEPPYGARDRHDMAGRIAAIPRHITEALGRSARNPWRLPVREPTLLAFGGMGGSAIAGELTWALVADRAPHPMLIARDDHWPACVGSHALALLSSYSGDTAETLALYREAAARRVPRVALTSGGTLEKWCDRDEAYVHRVPGGSPPRAALFTVWVPVTRLVHALGWCDDPRHGWEEAATLLERRNALLAPPAPETQNPAKQLARALAGRFVMIYAASERSAAVATRWRQQVNENAKQLAHAAQVPELDHNEIVGWERGGEFHARASVVLLRDAEDPADAALRLELTADDAARAGAQVHEVHSEGGSRIARMASLVQLGDWTSLYLALLNGVDPTPIASIDAFKRRLGEAAGPARA